MTRSAFTAVVFALVVQCNASAQSRLPVLPLHDSASNADLAPLGRLIGRARVIGLGESEHGVQEFLEFRNRFARFAVESLGVTALAAETGFNESITVDDYILGHGDLNPNVVGAVFSWSSDIAYEANAELLDWMRRYNARATTKRKVRFYGIDLTGGRSGRFVEARRAIEDALAYVSTVDSALARDFRARLNTWESAFATGSYDSLTAEQQNSLTAAIADLVSVLARRSAVWPARTSPLAFGRAYRSAIVASELNANFRAARAESNPQAQREAAMAENLGWVLEQEGRDGRVLLYEANWHISKGPMASDRWGSSLGEYLHAKLGADYVAIATAFGAKASEVPDSASLAALLARTCVERCWVNLRDVADTGMRPIQGGRVDQMVVGKAFDAVVFFKAVHDAR